MYIISIPYHHFHTNYMHNLFPLPFPYKLYASLVSFPFSIQTISIISFRYLLYTNYMHN